MGRQRLQYAARNLRTGQIEVVGSSVHVRSYVQAHGYWQTRAEKKAA